MQQLEPLPVIVDFLRGSKNAYIFEKEYQNLKTYGIGQDVSWYDWNQYLIQLINLGYCEIAFDQQNKIRLTPFAKKVLFDGEKVQLTTVQKPSIEKSEAKSVKSKTTPNSLFETLRKLRYEISKEEEVPAYVIFSDAALRQMETNRPMSEEELIAIDGVGKVKLEKYGQPFINAIIEFQKNKGTKLKKEASTYKETLQLYNSGLPIDEIASKRKLGLSTVISHIAKLYVDGAINDLSSFISEADIALIRKTQITLENATTLKPYYDYLEEKLSYDKIRLALAFIEKEKL